MYFPEGFLASPSAWPDKEKERMITVTSGLKCSELYGKSDPLGSLVRMLLESSRWYSPARRLKWEVRPLYSERITEKEYCTDKNMLSKPFVETLNVKDTPSNRYLFRLVSSERRTEGIEFGLLQDLLPTPRAVEIVEHPMKQAARLKDRTGTKLNNLSSGAAFGLLPTPTAIDAGTGRINKSLSPNAKERPTIAMAAKMGLLPTPMAIDIRHEKRVKELKAAGGNTFHSRKNGETRPNGLTDWMDFHGMLPTPTARDYRNGSRMGSVRMNRKIEKGYTVELNDMAVNGILPTPTASDKNTGTTKDRKDGISRMSNLNHNIAHLYGKTSQLNPRFVAEMMGFPVDWTVLPFLNGGKNP